MSTNEEQVQGDSDEYDPSHIQEPVQNEVQPTPAPEPVPSTSTPDLASVLRILAGLQPQIQQTQTQPQPPAQFSFPQIQHPIPQQPNPFSQYPAQPPPQQWNPHPQPPRSYTPPGLPPPPQAQTTQKIIVDPATITEWGAGLRCTMKMLAKHENILIEVRRMMKSQQEHEEQWWAGRAALVERQKGRKEGQKRLEEVLRSVGGLPTTGTTDNSSPEFLQEELKTFDMKVHKAQLQMVREMTIRLKSLGIPFFGTRSDLIRKGKEEEKGKISENELVELQRKILGLLEEMVKE